VTYTALNLILNKVAKAISSSIDEAAIKRSCHISGLHTACSKTWAPFSLYRRVPVAFL